MYVCDCVFKRVVCKTHFSFGNFPSGLYLNNIQIEQKKKQMSQEHNTTIDLCTRCTHVVVFGVIFGVVLFVSMRIKSP